MKRKAIQNANGITICDSIVMSVKRKRPNFRKLESVLIAVMGFTSVIMSFLGMFDFNFDAGKVAVAAVLFSAFYITLILIARKALWVILYSIGVFAFAAYKMIDKITNGFKFVYNIIYRDSFHTEINYYKYVKPSMEEESVTVLFIFAIWLMALVIYFFTIYRPNPILPLLVTFPVIEVGLYNGIEIPVFWGIMVVAYWLALLGMSAIDVGEYSGGTSGFVRKDNLFFPKRQMKLKVTEKCGMFIMIVIIIVAMLAASILNAVGYERSDKINKKRRDISEAFNEFTLEDLAASISRVTSAFGFKINYENNKLGNKDHITYDNTTDLVVTFDKGNNCAVYLKDDVSSIYDDNEWSQLDSDEYDKEIFNDFSTNGIFPQDFPSMFSRLIDPSSDEITVWINSEVKKSRKFCPYGTDNFGGLSYNRDKLVASLDEKEGEFTYKFFPIDMDYVAAQLLPPERMVYSTSAVTDSNWQKAISNFCSKYDLFTYDDYFSIDNEIPADQETMYYNGQFLTAQLLESKYKEFVYDNYLQIPDTKNMDEVHAAYSDILDKAGNAVTAVEKIAVLDDIRERMNDDCNYTLSPGKTPSNRDFVNYFLIENKKGYCIHYATAGVMLARMAGIPARYASGYIVTADDFNGDNMNPDGSFTVDVKDNRSHAWAEIYLDGFGWIPFEFTAGYSSRPVSNSVPQVVPAGDPQQSTELATSAATTTAPQGATTSVNTNSTTTSAASSEMVSGSNGTGAGQIGSTSDHKNSGFRFPWWLKLIIYLALLSGAAVGVILLRRKAISSKRAERFTRGSGSSRVGYMYQYAEKLLETLQLKNEDNNYTGFAENVEKHIGGTFVEKGSFDKFMKIALRSGFSGIQPEPEEIESCRELVDKLSGSIYEKSGFFRRLWLKLINVLV